MKMILSLSIFLLGQLKSSSQDTLNSYIHLNFVDSNWIEMTPGLLNSSPFVVYRISTKEHSDSLFVDFKTSLFFRKIRLRKKMNHFYVGVSVRFIIVNNEIWRITEERKLIRIL